METLYPIGIQNFEKIRKEGYLYIDKTALVYRLAKTGSYYFLSRPRRFGKSLLISTLEAYFQGKKELFEGLAMERLEKDWVKYPILHLDLNISQYSSQKDLEQEQSRKLARRQQRRARMRLRQHSKVQIWYLLHAAWAAVQVQVRHQ